MTSTIIMPQLGETVAEGKVLAWFKSVGDEIREGDNLFEVETDKVTIEVQAVVAGRLSEIRVGAGATAKVGEVVAVVDGDDDHKGDGAGRGRLRQRLHSGARPSRRCRRQPTGLAPRRDRMAFTSRRSPAG